LRPEHEVAGVLRKHWPQMEGHAHINGWQLRTLGAIMRCRTSELGGHIDACSGCGNIRHSYNSCRNRHCPKCQGSKREEWIAKREGELLPVPYFHVVFTLPGLLNPLAMQHPAAVYGSLFGAAWETIATFARDPRQLGARTGMICILHTWGQTLTLHPHLHCIVPGGGLTASGKWKTARNKGKFLFPVKAMSKVFRAKYLQKLREKLTVDKNLQDNLYKKAWVVYAKRPFAHPANVVEYLGRYTHKIAISNHRIKNTDGSSVTFSYKDYKDGAGKKEMQLDALEFIRRFSMHILPRGFTRIRHYGILSSTSKTTCIPKARGQLPGPTQTKPQDKRETKPYNPLLCPCCKTETMVLLELIPKRGPPVKNRVGKQIGTP
jgi:hypothetical protein